MSTFHIVLFVLAQDAALVVLAAVFHAKLSAKLTEVEDTLHAKVEAVAIKAKSDVAQVKAEVAAKL